MNNRENEILDKLERYGVIMLFCGLVGIIGGLWLLYYLLK